MCDDGGEFKGEFAELCKDESIEIVLSITGGRFVERFIRTLKHSLHQRTQSLGKAWDKYIYDVVDQYNETVHSSTGEKPDYLADNEYNFKVVRHAYEEQSKHAKFPTKHPPLVVGDHVKIRIKQKAFYKETVDSWTSDVYVVERVELSMHGKQYYLTGYKRPLLRFELKKVDDVQQYVDGNSTSKIKPVVEPTAPKRRRLIPISEESVYVEPAPVVDAIDPSKQRRVTRSMTAASGVQPFAQWFR